MSQDYQSGKFEDRSVLPEEKFQESMILACGLVFKWRGAKHESGGFHNFQHISAYFILATTKKTLQPSQI